MVELTKLQQKIFDKVKKEWEQRVGKGHVDDNALKDIILFADTNKDGKKRVVSMETGKTHLVPIEDIILSGLKSNELENYPIERVECNVSERA
jgi:benzoyl-CoA reductase/2-hydroxyglutaryl-CoA dehydratase subunit BcrC/BadD/HgdB